MADPADTAVIQILLDRIGSGYNKYSYSGASEAALTAHEAKIEKVRGYV